MATAKTISYASIEPLLAESEVRGARVHCAFRCPSSGAIHRASAPLVEKAETSLASLSGVAAAVGRTLRTALGFGAAPDPLAEAPPSEETAALAEDPSQRQDAIVRAFLHLSPPFLWDARGGAWVSTEAAGDLSTQVAQQLARAPVERDADRRLLARMLTEEAKADGQIAEDEWALLTDFILADIGSVDEFMEMPPLTDADLAGAQPGPSRETLLMLAWVMALSDLGRSPNELALLERFAEGLGVPPERRQVMERAAQRFVVDHALDAAFPEGELDPAARDEVMAGAERIGLPRAEADEVLALYRMRNEIV